MSSILAVILAAGEGTRMKSRLPKVLQPVGGQPMLTRILDVLATMPDMRTAVVYGHRGEQLRSRIEPSYPSVEWVEQAAQLGTGHALQQAAHLFEQVETVVVLLGDVPLIRRQTIETLCASARQSGFTLLTTRMDNPFGYGRIVRDAQGQVMRIVEEKDASDDERLLCEVNSGIMAFSAQLLQRYLPKLGNDNAQGEYYLTDLVAMCREDALSVSAEVVRDATEVMGVNNRFQLAAAEEVLRRRATDDLLSQGATLLDPARTDIHGCVEVGRDVLIEPNVVFKGQVKLGDGVVIESNCVLEDCTIGAESHILSHSRIESSVIGCAVSVGPFARIRPQTYLADRVKVGNFVETKAANIGVASKVNHLSYIGNADVGSGVNIGAGTITCNYDGVHKHQTVIGDNVFIGSNSALIAPIQIGSGATVGAGSTLSKPVSADSLTFTRAEVKIIPHWQKTKK